MRPNLGEFEELVLLAVCACNDEAYGVSVQEVIESRTERRPSLSAVHTALYRLQEKGYLISELGGATRERGGRRKRLFSVTDAGKSAVIEARNAREQLWRVIADPVFN